MECGANTQVTGVTGAYLAIDDQMDLQGFWDLPVLDGETLVHRVLRAQAHNLG